MQLRFVFVALACGAACGSGSQRPDAGPPPIDGVRADAPPPGDPWFDEGPHHGRIELLELASGVWTGNALAHANFSAQPTLTRFVFYARVAVRHWQQEAMRIGSCRLLQNLPASCEGCAGICVADDVCEPYPEYTSAGGLTFDGLRGPPLTLQPNPYFYASQGKLPVDAFADDAAIAVTASGDEVPAFSVTATAVPPLEATLPNDELQLADGADASIHWTAVAPADPTLRVRVTINANNQGHGLPYEAVVECDAADVGTIVIPSALIDRLPTIERWEVCAGSDCPLSSITRYRKGSVDVAGAPVDLVVGSQITFYTVHP